MIGWLRDWHQRRASDREARVLARRAIPDALWQATLKRLPFIARRSGADLAELRRLASHFLDSKEFSGAHGLVVTDEIAVAIAAQACLPVLRVGLAPYDAFVGIVVHPDEVVVRRQHVDEDGVAHEGDDQLVGEVIPGGPMMLSWPHVAQGAEVDPFVCNVVIHEFAHVIDMRDGLSDGVPPLPNVDERETWLMVLQATYRRFCRRVDTGRQTLLDPYAASGPDEFFAVASEAFFVTPEALRAEHPAMYRMLARFYGQDPAAYDEG
jgi:Mlc titration factor MtfA (ptsG expression regulator)